jgi:hypothetical protein
MDKLSLAISRLNDLADSGDPLSVAQVEAFEAELGFPLPPEYRSFLVARNGGRLLFRKTYDDWLIEQFFRLDFTGDYGTLKAVQGRYKDEPPRGFLPIGDGGSYSSTCICLTPDGFGQIIAWDRSDHFEYGWNDASSVLCDSLTEFLMGLEPSEAKLIEVSRESGGMSEPFTSIYLFDAESLAKYISNDGDVERRNESGETPLMLAVSRWPYAAARLLSAGADVSCQDNRGWTALHHAVNANSVDGVRLLLEHGADCGTKDGEGLTPLVMVDDSQTRIRKLMKSPHA